MTRRRSSRHADRPSIDDELRAGPNVLDYDWKLARTQVRKARSWILRGNLVAARSHLERARDTEADLWKIYPDGPDSVPTMTPS